MKARILLVMPRERQGGFLGFLTRSGLELSTVHTISEAAKQLAAEPHYDLLLADAELPDGNWRDVLRLLKDSRRPCDLVVCSRCGDERFWAEVIESGAFDLVPQPYDPQEVLRIIRMALDAHARRLQHPVESSRAC